MAYNLQVDIHSAKSLRDTEDFGRNDPYARVSLDMKNDAAYKKTTTKSNAGRSAEWNETVVLTDFDPSLHAFLYVEVMDEEHGTDAPIGFADIPLNQVNSATNKSLSGRFDLYTEKGKQKGTITLTISVLAANEEARPIPSPAETEHKSQYLNDHQERFKELERKEDLGDAFKPFDALRNKN
ncbi:hypothetical protein BX616_010664 [Lobosporangium transversale]|uniref:C2 domain-containing protein n=1 Tax=Lobosporangium transversale TaxID=64571 RepID=A0A1Y2H4N4_9FUNG|nr:C2 domain-containing protein [Lobosporangium transversale]KAF9911153.1 hypothetical protein BX616_010664 [Lobosporangium transversale]ORZ27992.1 C2 domain-containing protein [Lobosporangium transversale]|eukprot:XP_021885695.1 C2 domain-containing protein [Lobosporangium transversale]